MKKEEQASGNIAALLKQIQLLISSEVGKQLGRVGSIGLSGLGIIYYILI